MDQSLIPLSISTAEKQLALVQSRNLHSLSKPEFIGVWYSLIYLYPGLHPDGFECSDSGWPTELLPIATDAWRRFELGELSDDELYCYEAAKARLLHEVGATALESSKKPWLFTDHFSA